MLDEDFLPQPLSKSNRVSAQWWGLAALLIGCSILISATVMMVFTVIFEERYLGFPLGLALVIVIVSMGGVGALGIAGVVFGIRGWRGAKACGESTALGVAGTFAAAIGLGAWIAPTVYLILALLDKG